MARVVLVRRDAEVVGLRRTLFLFIVACFVAPSFVIAQAPTLPELGGGGPLGLPTEFIVDSATENASRAAGQDLTHEDLRIHLDLDFRTLDFDLVGLLFGGGTFAANVRLAAVVEVRAISVARLTDILEQQSGGAVNLSALGVNASKQVLTADEFRTLLAGEALAAFESEQERAVQNLVESSLPDLNVLSTRFSWENTAPIVNAQGDPKLLTEPPIQLNAVVDLQYLKRESLVSILQQVQEKAAQPQNEDAKTKRELVLESLRGENQGAFYERSAFSVLGITQLMVLEIDPGWDLTVGLELPKGYTFEYASADVAVAPSLGSAQVETLAGRSVTPVSNPVAVSLSNRYLVTVSLLFAVILVGMLLRVPVLLGASTWVARRAKRRAARIAATGVAAASATADMSSLDSDGQRGT